MSKTVIKLVRDEDGNFNWVINSECTIEELIRFYRKLEEERNTYGQDYMNSPYLFDEAIEQLQEEIEFLLTK